MDKQAKAEAEAATATATATATAVYQETISWMDVVSWCARSIPWPWKWLQGCVLQLG
jgi:hypothetical protein